MRVCACACLCMCVCVCVGACEYECICMSACMCIQVCVCVTNWVKFRQHIGEKWARGSIVGELTSSPLLPLSVKGDLLDKY